MKRRLNSLQTLALGFALIILAGAFLLWLPVSNRAGLSFLDCCYEATSATCVTGLVICDTWTTFTLFGQIILLTLIQIGGLGFMMVGFFFATLVRRRTSLRQRIFMGDSIGLWEVSGLSGKIHKLIIGVAAIEGTGAVILMTQFIPQFGWARGIWYGIFHSVSAFCNAGFDILGSNEPYSSLVPYQSNPVIILTISFLIILGGLGFFLWLDVAEHKFNFRKYHLHTKITLSATLILLASGTVLFYILESSHSLNGLSQGSMWLNAFFQGVTARTAGFNAVDQTALSSGGALLTIIFMFIGAGSGSTGGGIKVSTATLLLLEIRAKITGKDTIHIFRRSLEPDAERTAVSVAVNYLILAMFGSLFICFCGYTIPESFFEVFSALSTVGLTMGITRSLPAAAKIIVMILMYLGRVGTLSVAIAVKRHGKAVSITYPTEKVIIG